MTGTTKTTPEAVGSRLRAIRSELDQALDAVDPGELAKLADALRPAARIYVAGQGRSGLVGRAFAQRLMHIGFTTHGVGDITAPAIARGDVLVAITASGGTETTVHQAQKAKSVGAVVVAVSERSTGALLPIADTAVLIPSRPPLGPASGQHASTLFCQITQLVFDAVCGHFQHELGRTDADLDARHSNFE